MHKRIADENQEATGLLPPDQPDGSKIGVNYTDAYIRPLNVELEDGTKIACQRKGLKITLSIGDNQGEAIMNRLEHGPEPKEILHQALLAAAREAGSEFSVQNGGLHLDF